MIVPQFWAEGRIQHREGGKQITVRRFGWSDESEADAQKKADARAGEALQRLLSGEKLPRREPKVAYNGADGVPIREEIVDRRGDAVITRNSYGARCLNTPDVFFADIDFPSGMPFRFGCAANLILIGCALGYIWRYGADATGKALLLAAVIFGYGFAGFAYRVIAKVRGGPEVIARRRIAKFLESNPQWNLRVYRTPAGLRAMATHRKMSPDDPEAAACFKALRTDPMYELMCRKQRCFRARLSPKPWRIGMGSHHQPRPGVWPVKPEHLPKREKWYARYEDASRGFAACRFVENVGSGVVDPDIDSLRQWHDELSKADSGLPIA